MLFEQGTAIVSGWSGVFKTFLALELAVAAMCEGTFAGRQVSKRCGVLYFAAEGASEIPIRLQAAYENLCPVSSCPRPLPPLPFVRVDGCPRLLDANAGKIISQIVDDINPTMRERFGVQVGLVFIDTMAAAARFRDENSNAEGQRAVNTMTEVARVAKCLVVAIDHFGKEEAGTRGASAKEAAVDVVLCVRAHRDLNGVVSNTRLVATKIRGGPTGQEIPFSTKLVDMGTDQAGNLLRTRVIDWGTAAGPAEPTQSDRWPKHLRIFRDSLMEALNGAQEVAPYSDSTKVRAVTDKRLRDEFYRHYPADGDTEENRAEARRKAYNRHLKDAQERGLVGVHVEENGTIVWAATGHGVRRRTHGHGYHDGGNYPDTADTP
jgi:hypothetical protein